MKHFPSLLSQQLHWPTHTGSWSPSGPQARSHRGLPGLGQLQWKLSGRWKPKATAFKSQLMWGQCSAPPVPLQAPTRQGGSAMHPSQAASFITRITHGCFTSQACASASPSPSTSTAQVGFTTFGSSCRKPPTAPPKRWQCHKPTAKSPQAKGKARKEKDATSPPS